MGVVDEPALDRASMGLLQRVGGRGVLLAEPGGVHDGRGVDGDLVVVELLGEGLGPLAPGDRVVELVGVHIAVGQVAVGQRERPAGPTAFQHRDRAGRGVA